MLGVAVMCWGGVAVVCWGGVAVMCCQFCQKPLCIVRSRYVLHAELPVAVMYRPKIQDEFDTDF